MDDKPVPIRTDEQTRFNEDGTSERVYRVLFSVGKHGPFSAAFAADEFTPDNVRREMERIAATIRALY
jgi:hypothetical protein